MLDLQSTCGHNSVMGCKTAAFNQTGNTHHGTQQRTNRWLHQVSQAGSWKPMAISEEEPQSPCGFRLQAKPIRLYSDRTHPSSGNVGSCWYGYDTCIFCNQGNHRLGFTVIHI